MLMLTPQIINYNQAENNLFSMVSAGITPTKLHLPLKTTIFFFLIHASGHIVINTNGKEETEEKKNQMGRGHWVIDICYYCLEV